MLGRLRTVFSAEGDGISGYEFVFVNDASTDKSEEILRREIETHGDIVLVNLSRNFGVSESVYAGLFYATGDVVIYMDADLQDPPEVIPEMLERWRSDPEVGVVFTTRRKREGEHFLKLLLNRIGYRLINRVSNLPLPVDSGDFKLLSRRVVDELIAREEKLPYMRGGDAVRRTSPGLARACRQGLRRCSRAPRRAVPDVPSPPVTPPRPGAFLQTHLRSRGPRRKSPAGLPPRPLRNSEGVKSSRIV